MSIRIQTVEQNCKDIFSRADIAPLLVSCLQNLWITNSVNKTYTHMISFTVEHWFYLTHIFHLESLTKSLHSCFYWCYHPTLINIFLSVISFRLSVICYTSKVLTNMSLTPVGRASTLWRNQWKTEWEIWHFIVLCYLFIICILVHFLIMYLPLKFTVSYILCLKMTSNSKCIMPCHCICSFMAENSTSELC